MKVIIVLASCMAVALAKPAVFSALPYAAHPYGAYGAVPYGAYNYGAYPYAAAVAATPAISQHHAQDELGQYNYGYSGGPSAKNEVRSFDGVVRGSYSYVDANNEVQTVDYTAGPGGFKAAATNLPVAPVDTGVAPVDTGVAPEPVEDTPEVAAAKAAHLEAVEKAKNGEIVVPEPANLVAPEPVEETPEVKEATAKHLAAVEDAKNLAKLVNEVEVVAPVAVANVAPVIARGSPLIAEAPYYSHLAHPYSFASPIASAPVVAARSYGFAHPYNYVW
jgi:hypothetical protein